MVKTSVPRQILYEWVGYSFTCDSCGYVCFIDDNYDENDVDIANENSLKLCNNIYFYCPRCGQRHPNLFDAEDTMYEDIKENKKHNKNVLAAIAKIEYPIKRRI